MFIYLSSYLFINIQTMRIISQKAVEACKKNYRLIGALMVQFNVHQYTIERWFENKDIKLTIPNVVDIISKYTGLSQMEILEEEAVAA